MTDGGLNTSLFLLLLGVGVVCWFFLREKGAERSSAQRSTDWGMAALGLIVALGLWNDLSGKLNTTQAVFENGAVIEVPRRYDGHYELTLNINDTPVTFLVDTGATSVVLTDSDARAAGIDVDRLAFTGFASTANGQVRTAEVWVDKIELGGVALRNFPVLVNSGEMNSSLLGMDYLNTFERIEITGGRLVLER